MSRKPKVSPAIATYTYSSPTAGRHLATGMSGFSVQPTSSPIYNNQTDGKPTEPYFKCRFCKGKRFAKCTSAQLESEPRLCGYGTGLSIYKWIGRVLPIVAGSCALFWPINTLFYKHSKYGSVEGTAAIMLLVAWGVLGIMFTFVTIGTLHDKFVRSGGSIWGKE